MKRLILPLLALPLAACGPAIYQRANTTERQFAADQSDCHDYVASLPKSVSYGDNNVLGSTSPDTQMRNCMQAKGYALRHRSMGAVSGRAGFGSEDWSPGYGRGDGR